MPVNRLMSVRFRHAIRRAPDFDQPFALIGVDHTEAAIAQRDNVAVLAVLRRVLRTCCLLTCRDDY
jgi:hypothetical protein